MILVKIKRCCSPKK